MDRCGRLAPVDNLQAEQLRYSGAARRQFDCVDRSDNAVVVGQEALRMIEQRTPQAGIHGFRAAHAEECPDIKFKEPHAIAFVGVGQERRGNGSKKGVVVLSVPTYA